MSDIALPSREHALRAYLRAPVGAGLWPGVVVLHDVFGLTHDTRRQVDWLAASGYLALAPDLYAWTGKFAANRATVRDMLARRGAAFDDVDAARRALVERADCTGKIAIMGFSMGAVFALLTAAGNGFAAASINYGRVPKASLQRVWKGRTGWPLRRVDFRSGGPATLTLNADYGLDARRGVTGAWGVVPSLGRSLC